MLWQPRAGASSLTAAVKATFALVPGGVATIAPAQEPFRGDVGWDDDPRSSLFSAGDLVPLKRRVDVVLSGQARAPGGAPTESLFVQLVVGGLRKTLAVTGRRAWLPTRDGPRPGPITPFRAVPLRYELAARSDDNPIGVDPAPRAVEPGQLVPAISAMAPPGGAVPVAGFGPLRPLWRLRRHRIGDAGLFWAQRAGLGVGPPPPGFDYAFFNVAPPDQQVDALPPGVPIVLENLSPLCARLETRLPELRVKIFRALPAGGPVVELDSRCDTLFIDAERSLATLVWRAATPLERGDDASMGRIVVAAEHDGVRIGPADVERFLARRFPAVVRVALDAGEMGAPPAPESRPGASAPPSVPAASRPPAAHDDERTSVGFPADSRAQRARARAGVETIALGSTTAADPGAVVGPPKRLPLGGVPTIALEDTTAADSDAAFAAAKARARASVETAVSEAPPSSDARPVARDEEHTAVGVVPRRLGLPFAATPAALPFKPALDEVARRAADEALPFAKTSEPRGAPPPPSSQRGAASSGYEAEARIRGDEATALLSVPSARDGEPKASDAPKALGLGLQTRLGAMTLVTPASSGPAVEVLPFREIRDEPSAPPSAPAGFVLGVAPPSSRGLPPPMPDAPMPRSERGAPSVERPAKSAPPALLPLAVYCAIKAETWGEEASLPAVLERHGITEPAWRANEARQARALSEEAAMGRAELALALFDALQAVRTRRAREDGTSGPSRARSAYREGNEPGS